MWFFNKISILKRHRFPNPKKQNSIYAEAPLKPSYL